MNIPLKNPAPDVDELREVILRRRKPSRVHVAELHIDEEVVKYITEKILNRKWVEPVPEDRKTQEACLDNNIEVYYRLGFDCVRLGSAFRFSANIPFVSFSRVGEDTANLARKERKWTEEGRGVIGSWEDFEKYPWPSVESLDLWPFEYLSKNLPEGMGIWVCLTQGVLELVLNKLLGYESFSFLLYDEPELVKAVFDRVGQIIYNGYRQVIGLEKVVGFFQGDDMGFKTSTLVSPAVLREYVLPWHKRFAELAHEHGLLYVLHSCGNLEAIMEDLIEEVKIDAKHSFEDTIMPVADFKKKYGNRIGVIGGVDVDKLCRLEEKALRLYVRNILDACMQDTGYVLGSGNSVANYVPVENYLVMLDEGLNYLSK
ncbi:MAG: hypothetical protein GXO71_01280 [Caldiserica bacterium]|nr:hypothetical protein [Caldisericota bacterium]